MNNPYRTSSQEQRLSGAHVCACCQRPWEACVAVTGRLGDDGRRRTCPECYEHGASMMAANRKHTELWRSLVQSQKRDHDAHAARLGEEISLLRKQLDERPEKIVERYVDQQELDAARAEAQRAFQSRENAWQALCQVRLIHREGESGYCRCGKRMDNCKIVKIVDRYPGLEAWEKEQYQRLRDGRDHRLPDGHPAVLDPNWRP